MRHGLIALFLLISVQAASLVDCQAATSAEGQVNAAQTPVEERQLLDDLLMAQDLFRFAVRNRDVFAAVAAARVMARMPLVKVADVPIGLAPPSAQGQAVPGPLAMLPDMVTAARLLAGGSTDLRALIGAVDDGSVMGIRGTPAIAIVGAFDLEPGAEHSFRRTFRGEAQAIAALIADSATPFQLQIADPQNRLVCDESGVGVIGRCAWRPNLTEDFVIVVRNTGSRKIRYNLTMH